MQLQRMTKILFVYYMEPEIEAHWNDGLRAALCLIDKKSDFEVEFKNIFKGTSFPVSRYDLVLGWGGFSSPVDNYILSLKKQLPKDSIKFGLCIGGNALPPRKDDTYDVLFYETSWYAPQLEWHLNARRAFGINDDIFHVLMDGYSGSRLNLEETLYDYISVGSFSNWKRHEKILEKDGNRLVIGQIQRNNMAESGAIIGQLLNGGVAISDMVDPEKLALIYNLTDTVYIPADLNGGGERAVWEAISCGCKVEVEDDNPKLKELLNTEPVGHHWYATQLIAGIKSCLK